jgi:gliding motility-associated-like protein
MAQISDDIHQAENDISPGGISVLPTQEEIPVIVFPNPFTPNGDGYNDYVEFSFSENYTRKPSIQIFNIRGKKVIELNGNEIYKYHWYGRDRDGRDVEPGVYIYIFRHDGKEISNGSITLIR